MRVEKGKKRDPVGRAALLKERKDREM